MDHSDQYEEFVMPPRNKQLHKILVVLETLITNHVVQQNKEGGAPYPSARR